MRKFRFYNDRTNLRIGSSVLLTKEESEHIRKSLRLNRGDIIYIFNGEKEFKAELTRARNNLTMAKILEEVSANSKKNVQPITCYLSLIKAPQFELALQKLTELGIHTIIPMFTEYSVIKLDDKLDKKMARWEKIILEACKQSHRISVPNLQNPIRISDLTKMNLKPATTTLYFTTGEASSLKKLLSSQKSIESVNYLIGPEGGFSPSEDNLAHELGFEFVSLGDTVLKAETAAISVMSILQYELTQI